MKAPASRAQAGGGRADKDQIVEEKVSTLSRARQRTAAKGAGKIMAIPTSDQLTTASSPSVGNRAVCPSAPRLPVLNATCDRKQGARAEYGGERLTVAAGWPGDKKCPHRHHTAGSIQQNDCGRAPGSAVDARAPQRLRDDLQQACNDIRKRERAKSSGPAATEGDLGGRRRESAASSEPSVAGPVGESQ